MPSYKTTDFAGHDFYVGLDVHKKSWTVTVRTLDLEVAHFTQTPDADLLARQLQNKYPQGHFYSAYEAGFCGTTPHVDLQKAGFENIIIHAADLPQTDKQRKNKTDLHDSRAIARYLERGLLKSIHIMPVHLQEQRALFRCRQAKVKDVTRCINRLRSMLIFFGIDVPLEFRDKEYISKNFVNWLNKVQLQTQQGTEVLRQDINDLIYQRQQLLLITRKLRNAIIAQYKQSYYSMLTVPGLFILMISTHGQSILIFRSTDSPEVFISQCCNNPWRVKIPSKGYYTPLRKRSFSTALKNFFLLFYFQLIDFEILLLNFKLNKHL